MTSHSRRLERKELPGVHGLSVKRATDAVDLDRLARSAADGDAAAFEALVRCVFRRIYRWALVRVGDADEAEDIAQRVLLKLHRHLSDWNREGRCTTWLYRITANESSSWIRRTARRARRFVRAPDPGVGGAGRSAAGAVDPGGRPRDGGLAAAVASRTEGRPDLETVLDRRAVVDLVERFFDELPPRQREILDLVDFQGFTPAEVAEMLEMKGNTVRANLFKARRAIRERVLDARPEALEVLE